MRCTANRSSLAPVKNGPCEEWQARASSSTKRKMNCQSNCQLLGLVNDIRKAHHGRGFVMNPRRALLLDPLVAPVLTGTSSVSKGLTRRTKRSWDGRVSTPIRLAANREVARGSARAVRLASVDSLMLERYDQRQGCFGWEKVATMVLRAGTDSWRFRFQDQHRQTS